MSHVPTDDEHAFAVARGDHTGDHVVAVVTRLPSSLDGWADATVAVPAGTWSDVLSGATHTSAGTLPIGAVLATRPVSLLVRTLV